MTHKSRSQTKRAGWRRPLSDLLDRHASRILQYTPLWLTGLALGVYLLTMAPGITWEHAGRDGGDFITAAWVAGVPHPTGYPTFTMLAWVFTRLPLGSVAWRVNLLSGVAGAATVGLLFLIIRRSTADLRRSAASVGAVVGALLLAFAPLFWSHALISEVYTLHLCFIALVLGLMLRWRAGAGPLPWAALAFGSGMGNHSTLIFSSLAVGALLWSGRQRLSWRAVILSGLAFVAGMLVYLYLPWRASGDPIINWGDPDNWENFRWLVTGEGYRRFFFALPRDDIPARLNDWMILAGKQFFVLAWPLSVLGLWDLAQRDRWLALGSLLHASVSLLFALGYSTTDWFVNLLPVFFYAALWMGQGAAALLVAAERLGTKRQRPTMVVNGLTVGLLLLPLIWLAWNWGRMDLTHEQRAQEFAREALNAVEPGGMILVGSDAYTFALWYYRYVEQLRPDVLVVNSAMMSFDWYRHTIAVNHPEVVQQGEGATRFTKLDLILRNLDQHAIYMTKDVKQDLEDEGTLSVLELAEMGELWKVTSPQ